MEKKIKNIRWTSSSCSGIVGCTTESRASNYCNNRRDGGTGPGRMIKNYIPRVVRAYRESIKNCLKKKHDNHSASCYRKKIINNNNNNNRSYCVRPICAGPLCIVQNDCIFVYDNWTGTIKIPSNACSVLFTFLWFFFIFLLDRHLGYRRLTGEIVESVGTFITRRGGAQNATRFRSRRSTKIVGRARGNSVRFPVESRVRIDRPRIQGPDQRREISTHSLFLTPWFLVFLFVLYCFFFSPGHRNGWSRTFFYAYRSR